MRLSNFFQVLFFIICLNCVFCTSDKETNTIEYDLGNGVKLCLDEPVVVAVSEVGEKRWGHHQFVSISPYPGDRILLRYHVGKDAVSAYGTASPTYISDDKGESWKPLVDDSLPKSGLSCPLFNGEFICLPMAKPFNIKEANLPLPKPIAKVYAYNWNLFYSLDECPPAIQNYKKNMEASRWTPESMQWQDEIIHYDSKDALIWTTAKEEESVLVSRTTFERPPLKFGNELFYADYRSNYLNPDGSVPKHFSVTCMVSNDNGHNWEKRSLIATDDNGKDAMTEPMLAVNANGELVCVIRRTDHNQKSMMITFSKDRGKTWEKPVALNQLGNFGVMPCLTQLDCGVMALSYGRPGIWLSFSLNGTGREWTEPFRILEGDNRKKMEITDGYTTMLPIGPNQLLMAYTDFDYKDKQGNQRKAILVRKLEIKGADKFKGGK